MLSSHFSNSLQQLRADCSYSYTEPKRIQMQMASSAKGSADTNTDFQVACGIEFSESEACCILGVWDANGTKA